MFLWDNFLLVILLGFSFFIFFTVVNLMIDIKHPITTLVLTYYFLINFIKLPFAFTNHLYNSKESVLEMIYNDERSTNRTNKHFEKVFRHRRSIFLEFFKLGFFSYSRTMELFLNSYNESPFKIEIIFDLNKDKMKTKALEEDIHQDLAKSLNTLFKQYV